MILVGILSWWYGEGLAKRWRLTNNRIASVADFFSIKLLISTLFSPYKQISAEITTESFNNQIHAFFDKLVSRAIGATIRSFMIVVGLLAVLLQLTFGFFMLVFWSISPLLPAVGLILAIVGWKPI